MGYYAETVYTRINVAKNQFPIIEKRFNEQLKAGVPMHSNYYFQNTKREGAKPFFPKAQAGVEEIFSSFGFEPQFDKDGNIETLHYDDSSWSESSTKFILDLLEGLVDEGDHFEWLGSEGDDNRWINIHKNGKWETHDGYVEVKYSSDVWGPTEKHMRDVPEDEILWSLRIGDLEGEYDSRKGDGAYAALTPTAKEELIYDVKKGLDSGLGEAWADYMSASMDEALRKLTQNK